MSRPNSYAVEALRSALRALQGGDGPLCVGCGSKRATWFGEGKQRHDVFFGCLCDDCETHDTGEDDWAEPLYLPGETIVPGPGDDPVGVDE